ncbi:MAG: putative mariner mos1 transposase [Streblomastix strix]|uniref:Putative mariner mos1 transposase n=1 Tax=Streblomastix strix TaxID=222440 RepID=A0A5J4W2S3_9EUKA|nr:MAG: putative mariner mos1 transposase [Streblomastix strix]
MMTVFFNGAGLYKLDVLPERETINSRSFRYRILYPMRRLVLQQQFDDGAEVLIHYDNAPAHTVRATQTAVQNAEYEKLVHPPYSPDLAPCDFFLFRNLKQYLEGNRHLTKEQLLQQIRQILDAIPQRTWRAVFCNWLERLRSCIELHGEYVEI